MKTQSQLLKNTQKFRKTPKGVLTNMYDHMRTRHKVDFSLQEFHNMYLNNNEFLKLFKAWEKSGYNLQLKPSLDRTNPRKHYSFCNTTMMTWAENRLKQANYDGKLGRKPAVLQMLGDKVIQKYPCQRVAVLKTGLSQGCMSMVLNGKRKTVGGYRFMYQNAELIQVKP
jgi:hypothetical protein